MSFIEKSVARLDQQDRLEALAVELGKSHYHYNAPPKYYSVRPQWPPTKMNTRGSFGSSHPVLYTNTMDSCIQTAHWNIFQLFPVCRSWIHLCRAAHPEGEVHVWAGGGMEGEKVLVRCMKRWIGCMQLENMSPLSKMFLQIFRCY